MQGDRPTERHSLPVSCLEVAETRREQWEGKMRQNQKAA